MMKRLSETLMAVALAGNALAFPVSVYAQDQGQDQSQASASLQANLPASMSSQTRFMAEYILNGQHERHFVLIDKVDARAYVFENGRIIDEGAALLGQNTGDMRPLSERAVPAGQFRVIPRQGQLLEDQGYRRGQFLEFYCEPGRPGRLFCAGLHAVWLGKASERRMERLASETTADNNISNGCPNVSNEVFDSAWSMMINPANRNREGRTPYIYVLNEEDPSIQGTAAFFNIPQSYMNSLSAQGTVLTAELR